MSSTDDDFTNDSDSDVEFAPFHRFAAPTDEPLPEVPGEPDGFEAHLLNKFRTFGLLKAMAGDNSSVVGVLTVGRDWCRWDPPGGGRSTRVELADLEEVRLERSAWGPKNNHRAQLVFQHRQAPDGRAKKQFITTYYSRNRAEKPERYLRWIADSLTARARRTRGEPYGIGSELQRDLEAARDGGVSRRRPGNLRILDESVDGMTVRMRAFNAAPFFGCFGIGLAVMAGIGPCSTAAALIDPSLGGLTVMGLIGAGVLGFIAISVLSKSHVTLTLDGTGVTIERGSEQRLLWADLDSVEVGKRSNFRVNRVGKLPIVLTTTDGRRIEIPIGHGRGCVDERHVEWLADHMAEMILARAGGRAPEALTDMMARRPVDLEQR